MKMFRSLLFLIVFVSLSLTIAPSKSFAWSCAESDAPKQLFKKHDFVYIAKAMETSYEESAGMNPKSRTTFEVKSTLKGTSSDKATIVTTAGSEFTEGTDYLVYAYQTTKKNYLYKYEPGEIATDTWCGGTKPLSLASYDLEAIDEYKKMTNMVYFIIIPIVAAAVIVTVFLLLKRKGKLGRR
ncbi:hypothetical protein AB4Z50_00185 [Paenibacillus sp. 2TAB26]|uniref:hypothetical protein n=1 Tax=Paenibacillus sp. 2TAB26 TaxID=3233005 RepID=UPI003F99998F